MAQNLKIAFVGSGQVLHLVDTEAQITACGRSTKGKKVTVTTYTETTCNNCDGAHRKHR